VRGGYLGRMLPRLPYDGAVDADGHARSLLTGRGAHLSDRSYGLPSLPLPLPLRAQLHGASGLCLETRHEASGIVKNDPATGRFKARGTP